MIDQFCQAHRLGYEICDGFADGHPVKVWCGPGIADDTEVLLCTDHRAVFCDGFDGRAA